MREIRLRNGVGTFDRRLDRLPRFDDRSIDFRVRKLVGVKPLRSYTWRCSQHLDQGSEGACVGFGVGHELIARPVEVKGIDRAFCREQLYWEAQKIDEWPGGSYPGASPRYEGTSVLSGVKVAKRFGYVASYHWSFTFDEFLLGLGYAGPAVIGINWWSGMFTPDEQGFIQPSGSIAGGHCILVKAVNVPKKFVTVHNSWSTTWGLGGDAKVRFEDMQQLLEQGGEACFFTGRRIPKP